MYNIKAAVWLSFDMTDKIKNGKKRALSTKNDLAIKKNETQSSSFCCITHTGILFLTISNTVVAN